MQSKYLSIVAILFMIMSISSELFAQNITNKKEYIKKMIPKGAKLSKKSITFSNKDKNDLGKTINVNDIPDTLSFILVRSDNGDLIRSIVFFNRMVQEFNQHHMIAVTINKDGTVYNASLVGAMDQYSLMLAKKSFTKQFNEKKLEQTQFQKNINGVTGATLSSRVFTDTVRLSLAVFEAYLM